VPDDWPPAGLDLHVEIRGPGRRSALEDSLRQAIRTGRLAPGQRLPSTRVLAVDLGLSRGTVSAAYDQLVAEGFLVARRGAGTAVADLAPTQRAPAPTARLAQPRHDLRPGSPDVEHFPLSTWLRAARASLGRAETSAFDYGDPRGRPELRAALADYLGRTRGVQADPDQVVVTTGTTQALALLASALRRERGGRIAAEDPCFDFHRRVLAWAGAEVVPLPVDELGARTDALEHTRVAGVLVTPAHQYPTGVALHPSRRHELVAWARATGSLVVEDDYDGEFRYDRQPVGALQAMAPGQVAYLGSASKALAPAIRIGWMVLPEDWVAPVAQAKLFTDLQTDSLAQLTLAELIRSHAYDRHVRASRTRYRRRRERLLPALEPIRRRGVEPVSSVAAGVHCLVRLPDEGPEEADYLTRAAALDLALTGFGPSWHDPRGRHPKGLVVGFGRPADRRYDLAVGLLARLLSDLLD
jgi:GntR family transcriptional regulator/MocR family aminotransferase